MEKPNPVGCLKEAEVSPQLSPSPAMKRGSGVSFMGDFSEYDQA